MASYLKLIALAMLLLQFSGEMSAKPTTNEKTCKQAADLIFLVDTSSSIWPKLFHKHVKGFLKKIIGKFDIGPGPKDTRVGVALFSSATYLQFHLDQYWSVEDAQNAVGRMPFRGGDTYTHRALAFAVDRMLTPQHGAREGMARLVVVITDGKSRDGKRTLIQAKRLKAQGADVFAIGVGRYVDLDELHAMASTPSDQFAYQVTDFRALDRIMERFTQTTCQVLKSTTTTSTTTTTTATTPTTTTTTTPSTTTTTPTTTTTTTTTTTPTTTTTTTPATTTTTTPTTTTTTTPTTTTTTTTTTTPTTTTPTTSTTVLPTETSTVPNANKIKGLETTPSDRHDGAKFAKACKGKPADIYFLLDASSSLWLGHFHDRVLPFVTRLVSAFELSPLKTRFSLVTFSDEVKHVFGRAKHRALQSLLKSLQPENVAYLTGGTNTGDAIDFVTKQGLGGGASRRGVAQIVITVTDGLSQALPKTEAAARKAKEAGVYVFSVGVGKYVDDQELADVASDPDQDFVFNVDSFNSLSSITNQLAVKTCKAVALTTDDNTYQDKLDCSANPLNVMFLYEYTNSIPNSKMVRQHLVTHFSNQVAQVAPRTKIGIMTQPCVAGGIPLSTLEIFEEELALSRANDRIGLSNLVKGLRRNKFYGTPLTETRVAVLVLDAHTKNHDGLKREIKRLKFQNVRIMVAAVGKVEEKLVEEVASHPIFQNVIRVDSYDDFKKRDVNILKMLCVDHGRFPVQNQPVHVTHEQGAFFGIPM